MSQDYGVWVKVEAWVMIGSVRVDDDDDPYTKAGTLPRQVTYQPVDIDDDMEVVVATPVTFDVYDAGTGFQARPAGPEKEIA